MPAPTPLMIATQAVNRLVKEEKYYQKELTQQQERVKKLEAAAADKSKDSDENAEFVLNQERKALDETKLVFQPMNEKIAEAVSRLEEQVATAEGEGGSPAAEIAKAKEALSQGKAVGEPAV